MMTGLFRLKKIQVKLLAKNPNYNIKCPNCKSSDDIHTFNDGCTLLKGAKPHYGCGDCFFLWTAEYIAQVALGTYSQEK